MGRSWWISPSGKSYGTSGPPLQFACKHTAVFDLTEEQARSAMLGGMDEANILMEKLFYTPFILVEEHGPKLHVIMLDETYELYDRLMSWLASSNVHKQTVLRIILWKGGCHRQWEQTTETTLKGRMYSKNPDRYVRCNRCGENVPKEFILSTWSRGDGASCPKCGMGLA